MWHLKVWHSRIDGGVFSGLTSSLASLLNYVSAKPTDRPSHLVKGLWNLSISGSQYNFAQQVIPSTGKKALVGGLMMPLHHKGFGVQIGDCVEHHFKWGEFTYDKLPPKQFHLAIPEFYYHSPKVISGPHLARLATTDLRAFPWLPCLPSQVEGLKRLRSMPGDDRCCRTFRIHLDGRENLLDVISLIIKNNQNMKMTSDMRLPC